MQSITDRDRLNFMTQFRVSLEFNPSFRWWQATMESGQQSLGKSPRIALDNLMRFTRDATKKG